MQLRDFLFLDIFYLLFWGAIVFIALIAIVLKINLAMAKRDLFETAVIPDREQGRE
jgi:hypothetical protein